MVAYSCALGITKYHFREACNTVGTILARKRSDGTTAYMGKVVLKRDGTIIHKESKTFDRRAAAVVWLAKRETEIREKGPVKPTSSVTVAKAIDTYIADSRKKLGRTKTQVLKSIKEYEFAKLACAAVTSQEIVKFAQELALDKQPTTVSNYLSHLGSVFAVAGPAWNIPLDTEAMRSARVVLARLGIVGRSNRRDKRPALDELDRLMTHFAGRKAEAIPMAKIVAFALFSTRRQEEITRIKWTDLDEKHSRVLVRDMKDPSEKSGNDVWCDLPEPALRIIQSMPRTGERIFPYKPDSIAFAFRDARDLLQIHDLRFHDLRHEGISRLFEMGLNIPHVATVSGHRSWQNLKRYTHIRQSGDKYEGWKWLDAVTQPLQP